MTKFIHAYHQAPWRTQRQMIGIFLITLLAVAMVAALYLSLTANAAILGREVQALQYEITANERINADLQTRLALLTSTSEMERRARAAGFRPARPDELVYVVVAGYVPPQPAILAAAPAPADDTGRPAAYSQSLIEWFDQTMRDAAYVRYGASR